MTRSAPEVSDGTWNVTALLVIGSTLWLGAQHSSLRRLILLW
jgi:hypothetical protein